jgi:hypothetical protein
MSIGNLVDIDGFRFTLTHPANIAVMTGIEQ